MILLDEPTNSVDIQTKQLFEETVRLLKGAGKTVITITHDLDFYFRCNDRVIVLSEGKITEDVRVADFGSFQEFYDYFSANQVKVTISASDLFGVQ
ncbi:MAG: hypothetical protein LBP35_06950 [Candidatus Ancillula trichonymphae]|nr:hypothetical protein [Candidatus Ancillula trichonymphae]